MSMHLDTALMDTAHLPSCPLVLPFAILLENEQYCKTFPLALCVNCFNTGREHLEKNGNFC